MTNAVYIYRKPQLFELRNEVSIKLFPYYYKDIQRLNLELIGCYPMFI